MKTFFAVFVEADILQEGGRGSRGALLACAKGSSLELRLWSIFALIFRALSRSLSDWSPFRAPRALGRGDPVTDDAAADGGLNGKNACRTLHRVVVPLSR